MLFAKLPRKTAEVTPEDGWIRVTRRHCSHGHRYVVPCEKQQDAYDMVNVCSAWHLMMDSSGGGEVVGDGKGGYGGYKPPRVNHDGMPAV